MSSFLRNMYPGSFRGARFYIQTNSEAGGRKNAIHEFPDSDVRDVEDLGLLNRTFTLEVITYGYNSEYIFARDSLISELNKAGKGILSHPFEGALEVTPLTYTKTETLGEINVCKFSIVFSESSINPSAQQILGTASEIYDQANEAITLVDDDIISGYNVSTEFPNNFNDAFRKISSMSTQMGIAVSNVSTDTNYVNQFYAQQTQFNSTSTNATTNPPLLVSNINAIFLAANNIGATPQDAFNIFKYLFDFGSDDLTINFNTPQYDERLSNRNILNSSIQAYALLYSFQNAVNIEYETVEQISQISKILNDQFKKIYASEALSIDTLTKLAEIRIAMGQFFANAAINAFKLTPITTKTIPVTVLTYQYYGDIDRVDNIIAVNNLVDVSFVSGNLDILTQ